MKTVKSKALAPKTQKDKPNMSVLKYGRNAVKNKEYRHHDDRYEQEMTHRHMQGYR